MQLPALLAAHPARRIPLALAALCAATLASVFIMQYGFGLHPCPLCEWQRLPYASVLVLCLLAALHAAHPRIVQLHLAMTILIFLAGAGLAFYHTGVEYKWFPGPAGCTGGNSAGLSLEELRAAIMAAPLVSCADATAKFLGLSLAAWNIVASLGFAALALLGMRVIRRTA